MARAAVWMRADSNVSINCLKPLPSSPPRRFFTFDFEAVKTELIFLHAAIAEHFDFTAGHAFGWEGVFIRARGLFGEEHGQATVIRCVRIGPGQQGHDMGPCGVGDPGFVAGHFPVAVLGFYRAGAQRAEVRPGVWLSETQQLAGFPR